MQVEDLVERPVAASGTSSLSAAGHESATAKLNLLDSNSEQDSLSLPSRTTTASTVSGDPVLLADRRRNLASGRDVRWNALSFICHECYQKGYIKPNCPLTVKDLAIVPHYNSKLTEEERRGVPDTAYLRLVAFLNFQANSLSSLRAPPPAENNPPLVKDLRAPTKK